MARKRHLATMAPSLENLASVELVLSSYMTLVVDLSQLVLSSYMNVDLLNLKNSFSIDIMNDETQFL